jgi:hypothetical protein
MNRTISVAYATLTAALLASTPIARAAPILFSQSGDGAQTQTATAGVLPSSAVGTTFQTQSTPQPGATGELLASSQARLGSLSSSSSARLSANSTRGATFGIGSSASWKDVVTIDAPAGSGLQGQAGTFSAKLLLDGVLATIGTNTLASIGVGFLGPSRVNITAAPEPTRWLERAWNFEAGRNFRDGTERSFPDPFFGDPTNPRSYIGSGPSPSTLRFDVPFVFGQSFDFGVGLITRARIISSNGNGLDQFANSAR